MTGTDFSADGLMRRDVTGGINQGNAVASLHMTIMMNRISTVADRQPMVRKVKHSEMTGMPAKDTIKLTEKVIQFTDAGEVKTSPVGERNLKEEIKRVEKRIIMEVLEQQEGNRTRTALMLGISRRALMYKLQEYGIDPADV